MLKNREKLYQAYHTMLSMALTWAFVLSLNQYFTLKIPVFLSAVFSIIPALLIYIFDINKKNFISYIIIISIFPLMALIFWIRRFNPFTWLRNFTGWCGSYDGTEELFQAQYAYFAIFLAGALGAIIFYLLMKKQLAKMLTAAVILIVIIAFCVSKINVNKAVVGICIFYILTIIVELYGIIYSRKQGKQDKKEGILYLAPICLLLAVLCILLPSKEEPIRWKMFINAYNNMKEQISLWQTDLDYYFGSQNQFFSLTGYSENNGKLGGHAGKVVKDAKIALKVYGTQSNEPVYLTGSISDVYTGYSWEKSGQNYLPDKEDYLLDYTEMFYALSRQDPEVLKNNRFVERDEIRINYHNIKTKTFFYPVKTSYFQQFSNPGSLNTESAQIAFKKPHGKGTSYKNTFYRMNLGGNAFVQMLRDADTFSYDNVPDINKASAEWLMDGTFNNNDFKLSTYSDTYRLLKERADLIEAQYTKLPAELPERVRQLAQDITAGSNTTYDKLKDIEAYLMKYKYSLEAQKIPENEDFIDYFLFEGKKGYCTSFATAMAVLGRCIGVPTRYVEGYRAVFSSKDEDDTYPVKNSQAHAWAEAYIKGFGWVPFEATAPYYKDRYTKWADQSLEESKGREMADLYNHTPMYPYQNETDNTVVPIVKKDNSREILNGFLIVLAIIFTILLTILVYYYILKIRYRKTFEKADYNRKMYMLFLRILRLLKREGFVLEKQETILMLSGRIKDNFSYEKVGFRDVANIFMRYRYAEAEVTKAECDRVNVFCLGLINKQRQEENRFKIWLEEFIFLASKSTFK